jgi:hypothetical protein
MYAIDWEENHRLGGTCVTGCDEKAPKGYTCLKNLCDDKIGKKKKNCECMDPHPCSRDKN